MPPSDEATIARAASLANEAVSAIALQCRRLRSTEPEDAEFAMRWWADAQLLVVMLRRLRRIAELAMKVPRAIGDIEPYPTRQDARPSIPASPVVPGSEHSHEAVATARRVRTLVPAERHNREWITECADYRCRVTGQKRLLGRGLPRAAPDIRDVLISSCLAMRRMLMPSARSARTRASASSGISRERPSLAPAALRCASAPSFALRSTGAQRRRHAQRTPQSI